MDIQQLKTFYMVAKAGSFSKAVDQLNLSQPAISRQVMLLEESLNIRLFNRHARKGLVLTAEGETLLDKTTSLLRDIEGLKASLRDAPEPQGRLKIATLHMHASTWLMSYIIPFMKNHASLQVQLICLEEPLDLTLREADIYIGPYNTALISHEQDLLFSQHLKLYASEDYVAQNGLPTSASDLKRHRLLTYAYHRDVAQNKHLQWISQLAGLKNTANNSNNTLLMLNSLEGLTEAVSSGLGIAPLAEGLSIIQQRNLVPILPKEKSGPLHVYATYLSQSKSHTNVRTFLSYLRSALKMKN